MAARVLMYTKKQCSYCVMAEKLLQSKGVPQIEKIDIDDDSAMREKMMAQTGRRTVPQIFIGDTHVGGFDDLSALDKQGGLDRLLQGN
ncbi:MAG: glutaredoxin 3 [Burkholderiaceae bacterium]|jgi:glutaredoxin 3|nr:glutaredoxin 3 [Burkholderiaceae bacterium]